MYAVVNTVSATDGLTIGHVISSHYTLEAAYSADDRAQRRVRRANPGDNAYLPTRVVKVESRPRKGQYLHSSEVERVEE